MANSIIHDPPGYIQPSLQDLILTDIHADELLSIATRLGVDYVGPAPTFPGSFPVEGLVSGPNKRLMVSLTCRAEGNNPKAINTIFLINTGSPNTFLSAKAMEALVGKPRCNVGTIMGVRIHTKHVIECHLSPHDKHFADMNVLGANFLVENGLTLKANYSNKTCTLLFEEDE